MALVLPAKLAGVLSEREAIADTLYRAILAFDHADEALFLSAITEDISAEMAGSSAKGITDVKAAVSTAFPSSTQHTLSNMRLTIESTTTAKVTCSALAQHIRPGKGFEAGPNKFTSGGLYLCDVVKVGDIWKIKSWKAKIIWVDGDQTVMSE